MATNQPDINTDDHVFYNVLPQERATGPLANAEPGSVATASSPLAAAPLVRASTTGSFFSRNHRAIFIIATVVVLAVAGFFVYRSLNTTTSIPEEQPLPLPTEDPSEDTGPEQPEGVTTPAEWQLRYFGTEICQNVTVCGDASDPDRDGLTNQEEFTAGTDPNNADSSGGGIADGDKVHVFGGDPLKTKTKTGTYTDADYIKYGYDLATDQPFTAEKLADIKAKIKQYGLHQPTITTLGEEALPFYDFDAPASESTNPLEGVDTSASAQLDRDTQRSSTLKKIGAGLLKYQSEKKSFPNTTTFNEMAAVVKPYITVATNFTDPINKDKYVYGYIPEANAAGFTLTYFSETQNLLIKYRTPDAQADAAKEAFTAFDDQRMRDLENMRVTLLLYSGHHTDANSTQTYVFPRADNYKTELVPNYISQIPVDPKTGQDYVYQVGEQFNTFTLRAALDSPPAGTTGFLCNQDECTNF